MRHGPLLIAFATACKFGTYRNACLSKIASCPRLLPANRICNSLRIRSLQKCVPVQDCLTVPSKDACSIVQRCVTTDYRVRRVDDNNLTPVSSFCMSANNTTSSLVIIVLSLPAERNSKQFPPIKVIRNAVPQASTKSDCRNESTSDSII